MFVGAEQKMLLLKEQARKLDLSLLMAEGSFLPLKFHLYLSSVLFLVYVVAKLSLLLRAYTTLGISFATENKAWIRWVTIYSFLEIVLITPVCVAIYLDNTNDSLDLWNKSSLLFSSLSVFSAIFLFLHPKAIYGLAGSVVSNDKGEEDRVEVPNVDGDVQSEYVDQAELERVEVLIREKVFNGNRFLSPKYDLQHFSVDTGVKVKVLSAYLNNKLQMSLSDLLNQMRVDYCCQLMVDPEYYSYTLETLSEMSGFRNRTTFVNSFKKFKSSSPSAYWKSVKLIRDVDEKVLDGVQE